MTGDDLLCNFQVLFLLGPLVQAWKKNQPLTFAGGRSRCDYTFDRSTKRSEECIAGGQSGRQIEPSNRALEIWEIVDRDDGGSKRYLCSAYEASAEVNMVLQVLPGE